MADVFNDRVNEAQAQLQLRAKRLEQLLRQTKGKNVSADFKKGTELLAEMIDGQTKLIDTLVFEMPKSRIEQMRNLQLATGRMNQSPTEFIKTATDAIDAMLQQLEKMAR